MTLRLLRNLRTIVRSRRQTISRSDKLSAGSGQRSSAAAAVSRWPAFICFSALLLTGTACIAQQFQAPRIPGSAPISVHQPVQQAFHQQPQENSNPKPATYAPPVHITPQRSIGQFAANQSPPIINFSDESFAASRQPVVEPVPARKPSRSLATDFVQEQVTGPGLQDRIAQAFSRNLASRDNSSRDHSRPEARPRRRVPQLKEHRQAIRQPLVERTASSFAHSNELATRSTINNHRSVPTPAVRDSRREPDEQRATDRVTTSGQTKRIRQTSLQEPVQDPWGEWRFEDSSFDAPPPPHEFSAPVELARQDRSIQSRKTRGQSVSVLSNSNRHQQSQPLDEFEISIQPDLDGPGTPFSKPATPSNGGFGGRIGGFHPRQTLDSRPNSQDRLEDLMEETQNDLRRRGFVKEDSQSREPKSLLDLDDAPKDVKGSKSSLLDKSCDQFRAELLDNPLREIALDMSPPVSDVGDKNAAISRTWTDRSGNVIVTGTMVDLRRGYVILDGGQKIAFARLSDADLAAVGEYWQIPAICSVGNRGTVCRNWCPQTFTWTASSLCHKPLFFENVQLERYGHSHGPFCQPVHSFAHFFVSLVTVPYHCGIHPANECQYALGFYRPGDCAPWLKDPIPISLNGFKRQALVTTGLAVIP